MVGLQGSGKSNAPPTIAEGFDRVDVVRGYDPTGA
jgi:hypothetical protein